MPEHRSPLALWRHLYDTMPLPGSYKGFAIMQTSRQIYAVIYRILNKPRDLIFCINSTSEDHFEIKDLPGARWSDLDSIKFSRIKLIRFEIHPPEPMRKYLWLNTSNIRKIVERIQVNTSSMPQLPDVDIIFLAHQLPTLPMLPEAVAEEFREKFLWTYEELAAALLGFGELRRVKYIEVQPPLRVRGSEIFAREIEGGIRRLKSTIQGTESQG